MPDSKSELGPRRWALMGDVPAVLDGVWRRLEFNLFRPGRYCLKTNRIVKTIPFKLRKLGCSTVWVLYCLLTMFIVTGPTINTVCGLGGASTPPPSSRGLTAFAMALGTEPLQTLLLPAFVAIMGPREHLVWYTLGACVGSIAFVQGAVRSNHAGYCAAGYYIH